jgi:hypothetical protein
VNLHLERKWFTPSTTIGQLFGPRGEVVCFVLEDRFRMPWEMKVPGRTCIPCGEYQVQVTHSPRFGVEMPLLLDVPGFTGIRIHPGNGPADTEGCLLPGLERQSDRVLDSREAYLKVLDLIQSAGAEDVFITITALFT